ncbi:MAG TPA: DUF4331 domain-containing protein [Rhodanobacteraceae bacterium]|nr:DUF4331 domain-containing protein [Rhodanobacteraceae bacterium]
MPLPFKTALCASLLVALAAGQASASSHREAPFTAAHPKIDGADFYMFRSYEAGRDAFVTLIADYIPLQDAYGGPNYFSMDPNALYEIEVDNHGDAREHLTFQFRFTETYQNAALNIGGKTVPVPLINIGPIGPGVTDGDANKNLIETYTVTVVQGDHRHSNGTLATNLTSGGTTFRKPFDNIGNKSITDYPTYANNHIFSIGLPGCNTPGRVFVGQRKDPFAVNLGEIFDLVNLNPAGSPSAKPNAIGDKNVTSIALEVPIACLTRGNEPVIGAWTTASLHQGRVLNPAPAGVVGSGGEGRPTEVVGGAWTQVSRLGMPLVNEVVIGLPDKDRFNASEPKDDGQFANYVTNPTLPALLQVLFGVQAPATPRADLVAVFLTGVSGLNQPKNVTASEMLRLNTTIAAVPAAEQNTLGVLGGDISGFPNGRRPGDDVVDISLRAAMGVLLPAAQAPDGQLPYTDQTSLSATDFGSAFPYINAPLPGSP